MLLAVERMYHAGTSNEQNDLCINRLGFPPSGLSLDYRLHQRAEQNLQSSSIPVIPRSRSTFNLSRTCLFVPLSFFWIVPVNYIRQLAL
jgi:hypothetical protein